MAIASHYTVALHALTLIAGLTADKDAYVTSNQIAESVGTNPVFIRRILGKLAKARLVNVKHGGTDPGWKLARSPQSITLLDVYLAMVEKPLFECHRSTPNPRCRVGRGIQAALHPMYSQTETAMKRQLEQYTIAELLKETLACSDGTA
jgi:Predicted transcriptional regulator